MYVIYVFFIILCKQQNMKLLSIIQSVLYYSISNVFIYDARKRQEQLMFIYKRCLNTAGICSLKYNKQLVCYIQITRVLLLSGVIKSNLYIITMYIIQVIILLKNSKYRQIVHIPIKLT